MKYLERSTRRIGGFANRAAMLVLGTLALLAAGINRAFAGVAADAVTAIDASKTDVGLVQTAVIGVLVLLVVFLFIKRSMK